MVPKYNVDGVMDSPMVIPIGNNIHKTCDKSFLIRKTWFLDLGPSMMHIILESVKCRAQQREQVLRLFRSKGKTFSVLTPQ